ncbi:SWI/SNF family member, DNA-dependent ATPase, DNA repair and recombination protein, putative [Candida dubliniensis CD36]|uniref:SWI/SNF family member, DNA-dependent ATPase, DNA repair and recombination protein, putative n=1 Tax=Candida dubliniensis (strain CD36 / ATCC MYA-646 / CBS 7987 / NCPF 3949 / NRRL Y-17841) TaxID=573826 RepID=B9W9Y3_CANDC|nr:SWI/SNF family member, DNA-dependent ATPase, DNA repair and recombination protein, putative [Candida dubliniensis CD36]CAX45621.1 SWI/SNF family member, DNA-dependent ATPase, DNA repair and recombination protein, putative [Candida dubliniensis CD36]
MAVRKPLTQFTTPLGSGAGVPKDKRPPRVTDSATRLAKPFKVPFASNSKSVSSTTITISRRPVRSSRKRTNYADYGIASDDEKDDHSVNEDGQIIKRKKFGALLPRSVINSDNIARNEDKFRRSFTVPFDKNNTKQTEIERGPPPPLGTKVRAILPPRALHDPTSEFAIVLYDPTVDKIPKISEVESSSSPEPEPEPEPEQGQRPSKRKRTHKSLAEILGIVTNPEEKLSKYPDVPVVIDPKLAKILRPHQIAGVKFLYRCTAGLIDARAKGCIMADEMGLGKTLQCLALMWTLLRQSPRGKRTIEKCIIVCPSSLVRNWANEIVKWLGEGALTPLAVDGKSTKSSDLGTALQQWSTAQGRNIVRPVLIISYETLRRNVDKLAGTEVGLMLADEGHRLKNGDSLTFTALNSLRCERRVILSGTPIQNDLSEYFSLLNFANPGYLGTRNEFRKNYENAILRGRDSTATDEERAKGDKKLGELSQMVSKFIIRRTNDILSKYLPIKYEYVLFTGLSPMQKTLYNHFITSPEIKKLIKGIGSQPLKAIGMLKKLCNHPDLLDLPDDIEGSADLIPDDYQSSIAGGSAGRNREIQTWFSGKFLILERFLRKINKETDDKIVLISNYTQTLDLIEKMCRYKKYGVLRLDGTMNINKRQKLVDKFNDPNGPEFIFLLSSKAGGCGINLIGANRLVLIDPDWNPASDQQALARVWRDGQKKDCFIYRLISTGTIEEKIFQRQSMKMSLSSCVVDEKEDVERLFSSENLRQLFKFQPDTECDTHDTFHCNRCKKDKGQFIKAPAMLYGDATTWNHLNHQALGNNEDILVANEAQHNDVSFAFQYISH